MSGDMEHNKLIKPIQLMSQLCAIWPLERELKTSFEYIFHITHKIIVFIFLTTFAVAITFDGIRQRGDLTVFTQCALLAVDMYLCVLRLIVFALYHEDMKFIIKTIRADWEFADVIARGVLKDKTEMMYKVAKYSIFSVTALICTYLFVPILEVAIFDVTERRLPFNGYFGKHQDESPQYEFLYVMSVIAGFFTLCLITGAFGFNIIMVMHAAAKFRVVCKKFNSLTNGCNIQEVYNCVKIHHGAIIFADRVEHAINILTLGQFLCSTGFLCFAGFQLSAGHIPKVEMMKFVVYFNSAVLELFVHTYCGNQLISESEAVGPSIYTSNWVGANSTKYMQMVMMRSLIPNKITVGKFYDASLMSFSSTLSTAFSYLTVLRAKNVE